MPRSFQISVMSFVQSERRAFCSRARADRLVGLWAAARLGLGEDAADLYAQSVVEAGIRSAGQRGGFDKIASDLARTPVSVEAIRTQYAIAMMDAIEPALASREASVARFA